MPAFKTDESFLEKLSMGATGTKKVLSQLDSTGHRPIELERFSTNFKIWKSIKIKRIRVPDILCLACGIRIESRAKTEFEISMSHSLSDSERAWDFGMNDTDYVAIVVCEKSGERPIDWSALDPVQYMAVPDMRRAFLEKSVEVRNPKGATEGFEVRVVWPSAVASAAGTVVSTDNGRLKFRRASDQRTISLALARKGVELHPLVEAGDSVVEGEAVAAVVPVHHTIDCSHAAHVETYIKGLESTFVSDRYTAVKALAHFDTGDAASVLLRQMSDDGEHIYIRLESAAGLARRGIAGAWKFIDRTLSGEFLQERLEAVIILAEIGGTDALERLTLVIRNNDEHAEIRSGAAWALGELRERAALSVLIEAFDSTELLLRVEAARALARLAILFSDDVVDAFGAASSTQRAGVAWAIGKSSSFDVQRLLRLLPGNDDTRQWTAYVLGTQNQAAISAQIETLRQTDSEVYFAVTVLWKIISSWVHNLETY